MLIEFDSEKRVQTLIDRGLDFVDAALVMSGQQLTMLDNRIDYGEARFITVGFIESIMIMVVWTPRGAVRRIISMRKCNEREQARYQQRFS
ncbi:MAG: BrnT family toxin [Methylotenera sp.]|uniref:BrnT family toxin n=1 Tax=Methylotenera sp. TaxID=2051956 RepID=UPI002718E179|nr:BrnT family toxin [Methylotenera sp.]MDO9394354.1 BrnT family toxin [Methylotenera sp.]MDP1523462.1 BrnT family toxin [Methylotenera sp.]